MTGSLGALVAEDVASVEAAIALTDIGASVVETRAKTLEEAAEAAEADLGDEDHRRARESPCYWLRDRAARERGGR